MLLNWCRRKRLSLMLVGLVVDSFCNSTRSAIRTCDENGFPQEFVRCARGTVG
jgi:hypothetical protein